MSNTAPITTIGITTPTAIATESEKANFMAAKETTVSLQPWSLSFLQGIKNTNTLELNQSANNVLQ